MDIIPAGLLALCIWFAAMWRGVPAATTAIIAMLPFGMLAAVNLPAVGGLSLKTSSVCAGLLIVWLAITHIRSRDYIFNHQNLNGTHIALIFLSLYVVISAVINVRIFQGEIDVFSLNRGIERSGRGAIGMLTRLRPGASNISQVAYILLSSSFFFSVLLIIHKHGISWIHRALVVTAVVHLVLFFLDALELDGLLSFVRTANYALLKHHEVHGFARVIGGFSEPSAFGSFSSSLLGYFSLHTFSSKSWASGFLALALGVCVILSFSSAAYFGAFFVVFFLFLMIAKTTFFGGGIPRGFVYLGWFVGVLIILFVMMKSTQVEQILDSLIFNKASSASGQERGLWAEYGLRTFLDTYGLGAGVGSIRSNGWLSVYLGSVGIPGFLLASVFWLQVLLKPSSQMPSDEASAVFIACKAAVFVTLMMKLATATTPNPGLLLMFFAASITALRAKDQYTISNIIENNEQNV
ncbi:MAG: hypothetical protein VXX82_06595 [Verrucomicrobiota bacterium]|nr:hypothetical protein [Verrucomicrobiota bacterium]